MKRKYVRIKSSELRTRLKMRIYNANKEQFNAVFAEPNVYVEILETDLKKERK